MQNRPPSESGLDIDLDGIDLFEGMNMGDQVRYSIQIYGIDPKCSIEIEFKIAISLYYFHRTSLYIIDSVCYLLSYHL